jgi:mannonate dehydratase
MPIFDWTRSQLDHVNKDGSQSLVYYEEDVAKMDPTKLTLPGWDASYKPEEVAGLIKKYQAIGEEGLWANLKAFLEEIIPVAAECNVNMAIHPDDPAWPIFGIPRLIINEANTDRFLKLVDDSHNGLTFCTGSFGSSPKNDIVHMIGKYSKMGRIHFAHLRNVRQLGEHSFEEAAHLSCDGSLDMVAITKALKDGGFNGYIRPDHGRMIWDEQAKPGYGLYDRALGAVYLNGIWETLDKLEK